MESRVLTTRLCNQNHLIWSTYGNIDSDLKNKEVIKNIETEDFDEIISNIEKLADLKEKGIISEYEYKKKKKDLLKKI